MLEALVTVTLLLVVICVALSYTLLRTLRDAKDERADLLQRIQDPQLAVAQHAANTVPLSEKPYIDSSDHGDHEWDDYAAKEWAAHGERLIEYEQNGQLFEEAR